MKKKLLCMILCVMMVLILFPVTVSADMGPKPSVHITFQGLGDELCYGTLLSKTESTGPSSVWDGIEKNARHNENESYSYENLDYKTWKAFVDYKDADGYYFLQEGWRVDESKTLAWTYYPPNSFKILLYYPKSNTFVVSSICERYAFDSYFTADMEGIDISSVDHPDAKDGAPVQHGTMDVERSYDYNWEIVSLIARIIITMLLEFGIALIFKYCAKKQLLLIAGVNAVTQIALNILLNVVNYNSGQLAFVINYILLELIVFALEAVVFYRYLDRLGERHRRRYIAVIYALVANAASFGVGFAIAKLIPGIF